MLAIVHLMVRENRSIASKDVFKKRGKIGMRQRHYLMIDQIFYNYSKYFVPGMNVS